MPKSVAQPLPASANPAPDVNPARPRRTLLRGALAGSVGLTLGPLLSGCQWLPRTPTVPMPTLALPGRCPGPAPVLLVMLPGAYSAPEEFIDEGFVAALQAQGVAADVRIADAHLGYLRKRSVLDRLHQDVLLPARVAGYRRIWLVGISLGGFVALGYAARHAGMVEGVVALAPYLGRPERLRQIADAGGPLAWRAEARAQEPDDLEFDLWQWLAAPPAGAPPVYLGYGTEDRLADGHRLLAPLLPRERVSTVQGGHDWPPWRALWQAWLSRGLLPSACSAPQGLPRLEDSTSRQTVIPVPSAGW